MRRLERFTNYSQTVRNSRSPLIFLCHCFVCLQQCCNVPSRNSCSDTNLHKDRILRTLNLAHNQSSQLQDGWLISIHTNNHQSCQETNSWFSGQPQSLLYLGFTHQQRWVHTPLFEFHSILKRRHSKLFHNLEL